MPCEEAQLARAVASLDDRHACRQRVLSALEDLIQFEESQSVRQMAKQRYLDLTDQEKAA